MYRRGQYYPLWSTTFESVFLSRGQHLKVLSLVEMTFKTVIPIGGRHLRLLSLAEDDI